MDREELHALWHITALVYASNNVSERFLATSAEVHLCASAAIVVRNIASAETKRTNAIINSCLLKLIRSLALHEYRLYDAFYILAPEFGAFLWMTEFNVL